MTPKIKDAEAPVSAAQLDALEDRLGTVLPPEYRAWLLRFNGGRPDPARFRYKYERGAYTDSSVAWFFAVHDGPYENFERKYRAFKLLQRRLPEHLVPIAGDPFGNMICMSFGGEDKGKIYFWDHEEEPAEPSYDNCHLIADSFDEFITGLH
jgi:hypothetical protein